MIPPNRYRRIAIMIAGLALSLGAVLPAWAAEPFAGKTVRIVVNFAAGGPADTFIRHFVPYLGARIPGNPTIVVENRTGAAGRVGSNYIYNAAPADGTTIGFLVAVASQEMIGGPTVKFETAKFRWLGAIPQSQVLLAHKSLGVASPSRLREPANDIVYGATGASSINGLNTRLFLDLIGVTYKHVTGYRGQAGTIQALRQGEVNLTDAGIAIFLPNRTTWKNEGLFVPIIQRGVLQGDGTFRRHSAMPGLPTMPEVIAELAPAKLDSPEFRAFRALVGTYGVQFPLVLPPAASHEIVSVLARAVSETFNDAEAKRSAVERFKFAYDFVGASEAQEFVEKLFADYRADPRVPKAVQDLITRK